MNLNIAVLIDGENIPSAHVQEMMEEIAKYGNPTIKRIWGLDEASFVQMEKRIA